LSPGGAETFLKNGSKIDQTQSAIVLENLINKLFASFSNKPASDSSGSQSSEQNAPKKEEPKK
jgi:hypothetical protein